MDAPYSELTCWDTTLLVLDFTDVEPLTDSVRSGSLIGKRPPPKNGRRFQRYLLLMESPPNGNADSVRPCRAGTKVGLMIRRVVLEWRKPPLTLIKLPWDKQADLPGRVHIDGEWKTADVGLHVSWS